jgi:hypothetical protein
MKANSLYLTRGKKTRFQFVTYSILYFALETYWNNCRNPKHSYCSLFSCYITLYIYIYLYICTATNAKFSTMKMGHLTKALIWSGGRNRAHCTHRAAENWDVLRQVTLKFALLFTAGRYCFKGILIRDRYNLLTS